MIDRYKVPNKLSREWHEPYKRICNRENSEDISHFATNSLIDSLKQNGNAPLRFLQRVSAGSVTWGTNSLLSRVPGSYRRECARIKEIAREFATDENANIGAIIQAEKAALHILNEINEGAWLDNPFEAMCEKYAENLYDSSFSEIGYEPFEQNDGVTMEVIEQGLSSLQPFMKLQFRSIAHELAQRSKVEKLKRRKRSLPKVDHENPSAEILV